MCTRGSPVGGAPTSSSICPPCALASGSSSSSVGRRWPLSRRDRVLTEIPVASASAARVRSRCRRSARSRGPTAASTVPRQSSIAPACQISKRTCEILHNVAMVFGEVSMTSNVAQRFDVAVIGGGAAGLSAAVALGRARRAVIVLDDGSPRNAPAHGVHNYLTRDGMPPAELLAAGRREAEGYGVIVARGEAISARRTDHGFEVTAGDGEMISAGRLVVTSGLADELPEVPGVRELWGTDVVHCPYCHGWEVRDQAIGVLGSGPMAVHQALLFRQWTDDLVLFLHTAPPLAPDQAEQLAARGIRVVSGPPERLETAGGRLTGVRVHDGTVIARSVLVVGPGMAARSRVPAGLGLPPGPHPAGRA